jgi:hypothetical protein
MEIMNECTIIQAAYPECTWDDHGLFQLLEELEDCADQPEIEQTQPVTLQVPLSNGQLVLRIELSEGYPETPLVVSSSADNLSRSEVDQLHVILRETADEAASQAEPGIFDTLQAAEDFLQTLAAAKEVRNHEKAQESPATPILLGRRLIYSHHIIAQQKRAAIRENAADLKLGGFVKHGWPGLIVVEGSEENAAEFVRRLKRYQWQHLEVRGDETVEAAPNDVETRGDGESPVEPPAAAATQPVFEAAIDALRSFPVKFEELGDGPHALTTAGDRCREAGLAAFFETFFRGCKAANN